MCGHPGQTVDAWAVQDADRWDARCRERFRELGRGFPLSASADGEELLALMQEL